MARHIWVHTEPTHDRHRMFGIVRIPIVTAGTYGARSWKNGEVS